MTSMTNALNQSVTMSYDANGYLTNIIGSPPRGDQCLHLRRPWPGFYFNRFQRLHANVFVRQSGPCDKNFSSGRHV